MLIKTPAGNDLSCLEKTLDSTNSNQTILSVSLMNREYTTAWYSSQNRNLKKRAIRELCGIVSRPRVRQLKLISGCCHMAELTGTELSAPQAKIPVLQ